MVVVEQDMESSEKIYTQPSEFIAHIRPDLKKVVTTKNPVVYWTMESYSEETKGQGGLGMLASDTEATAERLDIPVVFIELFYPIERSYALNGGFDQVEYYRQVTPAERGLVQAGTTHITTSEHPVVPISVFTIRKGSVTKILLTEPNLGQLYEGESNSDRRLYQEVVEGFAGQKALKMLRIQPSMNHYLNEAPTVFAALARLDDQMQQMQLGSPGTNPATIFSAAFVATRENTVYTNHTLVQAAEAELSLAQFEHFVIPNIQSGELKKWLRDKINSKNGLVKLSTLAIALSGKRNGVSLIHAQEASKTYKDDKDNLVEFTGITNGIALDRWTDPDLLQCYRETGVIDKFDLPDEDYETKIDRLDSDNLRLSKSKAKNRLREYLKQRQDQYQCGIDIPEGEKIFNWRRRFADYKRPGMIFDDPQRLAEILENESIHLVVSGNVHPADNTMRSELKRILSIIDQNPVLRSRVHFVQDYDEDLGRALVQGADASINTPTVMKGGARVSTEACGTSWEKDIINNTILISTEDGGVADARLRAESAGMVGFKSPYLEITGASYPEEVDSLYGQIQKAARIVSNEDPKISWGDSVKGQLKAFLPVISSARMAKDYLDFGIPVDQAA